MSDGLSELGWIPDDSDYGAVSAEHGCGVDILDEGARMSMSTTKEIYMKNADMPAMPIFDANGATSMLYGNPDIQAEGFTKREMMAMHMMAGLLAGCEPPNIEWIASISVDAADKLLAELEKRQ